MINDKKKKSELLQIWSNIVIYGKLKKIINIKMKDLKMKLHVAGTFF